MCCGKNIIILFLAGRRCHVLLINIVSEEMFACYVYCYNLTGHTTMVIGTGKKGVNKNSYRTRRLSPSFLNETGQRRGDEKKSQINPLGCVWFFYFSFLTV